MSKTRFTNPVQIGNTTTANAAVTADMNYPVVRAFVRVPVSAQTTSVYYMPKDAILVDMWVDISTAWTGSGDVAVGSTDGGTEYGNMNVNTSTGRVSVTLTGARTTAMAGSGIRAGNAPVYLSPATTTGSGVGVVTLEIGFAGFSATN